MQWLWRILTNFLRKLHQNTAATPIKKGKAGGYGISPNTKKGPRFSEGAQDKPAESRSLWQSVRDFFKF